MALCKRHRLFSYARKLYHKVRARCRCLDSIHDDKSICGRLSDKIREEGMQLVQTAKC